jgi:nucleoside-diphosphate-sugar epimerase
MKYFVTGATGFLGGSLVRQLRSQGHEVIALVRSPEKARELTQLGVTLQRGDVMDRASLRGSMIGANGIFHVAGWYKLGSADHGMAHSVNVEGTRNVLEIMHDLRVPRGVYTSTLAVYSDTHGQVVDETYRFKGRHLTEYDRTKAQAHYDVAEPLIRAGLPLVIVQPGVIYGPGDQSLVREMLVRFLQGKLPFVPRRTAYCWAHVEDVARAHLLAMERGAPGRSYHLAGPVYTLVEVLELAARLTGLRSPRSISPILPRLMAAVLQPFVGWLNLSAPHHPESLRAIGGVTYLGDSTRGRREIGFDTRPLEEGLRETLEYEMKLLGIQKPEAGKKVESRGCEVS